MKSDYFQTADNLSMSAAASVRPLLFAASHKPADCWSVCVGNNVGICATGTNYSTTQEITLKRNN